MTDDISFGFSAPVMAGAPRDDGDPAHINTPLYEELDWERTRDTVLTAEALGFDSAWVPDHLLLGRDHAEYECWTLLSAIAGMTDLRVGSLVLCNDFRNPALVAKMAATLDVISGGGVELGLGAGWNTEEYNNYGWEWREGFDRLMRLDESVRLIKRMWTEDAPSFDGDHYQVENAYCEPGPVQDPHPPILVGGDGEEVTLKLVARHADVWNTTSLRGHPDLLEHKLDVLRGHCETVGREYADIEKSWESLVLCTRDEELVREVADILLPISTAEHGDVTTVEQLKEFVVMGSPEECAEALEARTELGFTKFQLWFLDVPETSGMELFADEVMPQFG
jgi:alkanesulfonate monooxygenase SsuD/methylene tetrahydromethanopterin reductase-like flavin-dependent oxidoreductase (luciferase family)